MDGVKTLPGAPPRRGSFQEDIDLGLAGSPPSKNRTPSISAAIQANNDAVSNNHALSATSASIYLDDDDDAMLTDDDPGFMKSASASRRNSTTPATASQPWPSHTQSPSTDGDVIEVNQNAFQLPLDPTSRGKLKNRYIMPDGKVINGKGLGRGRPGVKRGPRKSALSREITEPGSDAAVAASTPSPAPQAKQVSSKRKRKDSDVIKADDEEDEEEDDDDLDDFSRESTPEYNPAAATHTRSGRQSQKPATIITPVTSTASPSTKRPAITPSTSSPSIKKHPKIKPKVYRGREQFALCEHCLRQHGPPGNVIVFCDACNKCWHQRCHDPRIPKEVVEDTQAEWFCTACDKILHPKRKTKALPKPTAQVAQATPPPTIVPDATPTAAKVIPRYSLPLVPGMSLTLAQRKDYLSSLAKERLVEIVLQAANLAPNMPIFETPLHLTPQFLPGQPYPIFVQPQPPTKIPPQLQSQPQPQPQPQPEEIQPDNQQHPSAASPPFDMNIASMPPPPPPSQLPPHLRAQFTSSLAASGHMPPQPASSSSSVPTISPSASTSTSPVQPSSSASEAAPTNTNFPTNRPIYTHPTAGTPTKPNTQPTPPVLPSGPSTTDPDADEEDEGYYDDFDEMALLYPKPGKGAYDLAIPPESSDLGIMLEGPECVTFSHVVY
ncbi:hypothetical protein LTR70_004500 [Exophiala xenobiotica]|uniref:PHD-type domain-containing protein n=1 Tax=Lithohypha guttulata TaxID=1690604 RepID=A0ABR0KPV7_9EURO|nr:hypothetical protein LTR24_000430 [Lithohypha guttulata]KAK5320418.1 hypothetical protein LTR70_004500 [Exophiala xenobiotica]